MDAKSIDERDTLIGTMSNSAKKTYNLLENLLQWSRSETGRLTVQPVQLNMKEMVDETINLLLETINQKSITIKNIIQDKATAVGDSNMIKTVIKISFPMPLNMFMRGAISSYRLRLIQPGRKQS
jgi:signal transduction histidine kinase